MIYRDDGTHTSKMAGDTWVVTITGKLDTDTSPSLNHHLQQEISAGRNRVLINLAETEHLSSAGLGVLINIQNLLNKTDGRMKLCIGDNDMIRMIFRLHGIAHIFELYGSEEEALAAFNR